MNKKTIHLVLIVFTFTTQSFAGTNGSYYNVKDFGAKGDGKNLDSKAINLAIETASEAGGGTCYFPAGTYLSGSIHLKSNICLFIDQGAIILAAPVSIEAGFSQKSISEVMKSSPVV